MKKIQFHFETEWMSFKHSEKRDLLAPLLIHNGADVNGEKQSVDNLSPMIDWLIEDILQAPSTMSGDLRASQFVVSGSQGHQYFCLKNDKNCKRYDQ